MQHVVLQVLHVTDALLNNTPLPIHYTDNGAAMKWPGDEARPDCAVRVPQQASSSGALQSDSTYIICDNDWCERRGDQASIQETNGTTGLWSLI